MSTRGNTSQSPFDTAADMRRGLETLNDSTQRILNHVKALEAQKQFLQAQHEKQISSKLEDSMSKQEAMHLQHLKSLNEELAQNIESKLQSQQEKINHALSDAISTLNAKLNADDRKLNDFDSLMHHDTASGISNLSQQDHRNSQLLEALRLATCEKIKLKLNRTYLEALQDYFKHAKRKETGSPKTQNVQDDLSNLFAEIEGVVELLISHDHGQQLKDMSERLAHLERENKVHGSRHISHQLASLTDGLSLLAERNEMIQSHRTAIVKLRKIQHNIMPSHRRRPSETSYIAVSKNLKLESLRRQLDISSSTSLLEMRKSVDQVYKQLRSNIENARDESTRHHQTMLSSSGSDLDTSSLMLTKLDKTMAVSKARMDDIEQKELEQQMSFKEAWVNKKSQV